MSSDVNLEELFIAASDSPNKKNLDNLYAALEGLDDFKVDAVVNGVDLIVDTWQDSISENQLQRDFVISLAELNVSSSTAFKNLFAEAIKESLPPYLRKPAFVKHLDLRGSASYSDIITKFKTLLQLKANVYIYFTDNAFWGQVTNIDEFAGTVYMNSISGRNSTSKPINNVLLNGKIFKSSPTVLKLAKPHPRRIPKAKDYMKLLDNMGLVRLSENMKFNIAKGTLLPTYMNEEQFDEWSADIATKSVDSETAKTKATKGKRGPADARSFKELYLSLKEFHKENSGSDYKFSEEEVEKLKQFFSKETIHITDAEVLMLAESISFIVDFSTDEVVLDMMTPTLGKYSFWAEHPESIALVDLEIWGKIPAKRLPQFIKATELLHSEDYIARYITVLPMRCLNSLCDHVNHDLIKEKVLQSNNLTSDIILWVWKNRKKKSKDLLDIVSIENVVTAVSTINLPQVWLVAQRDLKKNFIGDEEFQKLLIDNAVTPASLAFAIQSCNALTRGERSSLIVKLSKLSEEFKDYFESSGRAEQILGTSKEVNTKAKVSNEPMLTSIASYKKKQAELENIISVELPENKEAISVAREHGDLKENSEYKYAKQQQRFLNSRCADLEKELGMAQAIDFSDIKVADSAVLGSTVEVKYDDDSKDTFYLVGAWDGDVADDAVSYKAPISEFLLNKKVGDKVELPSSGGSSKVGSVTSIKALPKKVLKELVG